MRIYVVGASLFSLYRLGVRFHIMPRSQKHKDWFSGISAEDFHAERVRVATGLSNYESILQLTRSRLLLKTDLRSIADTRASIIISNLRDRHCPTETYREAGNHISAPYHAMQRKKSVTWKLFHKSTRRNSALLADWKSMNLKIEIDVRTIGLRHSSRNQNDFVAKIPFYSLTSLLIIVPQFNDFRASHLVLYVDCRCKETPHNFFRLARIVFPDM